MSNFLFSLNVTMPIFLVMVIGWILRQIGMLDEHFVSVCNKFNFKVTLPFMVFRDLSGVDIRAEFDLKFVLFCAVSTTICFWAIWGAAKLFLKKKKERGAFVQASFRSSAAVMGLAFINNIYGASAMGPMMIIGAVPLYNIFSVLVLTFEAQTEEGENRDTGKIKDACINIAKNPIIISIILGVVVALLGIDFPTIIDKTVNSVAQLATPLALIGLGAGFEGRKALAKMKPTLWASAIKLVIQPLVFLPAAMALGFTGEKIIAILIMLAAPATPSCYIMAKNMNNDGVLTASIVVMTTLLAAFTLTGWIYLLKTLGLI
jgi:hypothetical protein